MKRVSVKRGMTVDNYGTTKKKCKRKQKKSVLLVKSMYHRP